MNTTSRDERIVCAHTRARALVRRFEGMYIATCLLGWLDTGATTVLRMTQDDRPRAGCSGYRVKRKPRAAPCNALLTLLLYSLPVHVFQYVGIRDLRRTLTHQVLIVVIASAILSFPCIVYSNGLKICNYFARQIRDSELTRMSISNIFMVVLWRTVLFEFYFK